MGSLFKPRKRQWIVTCAFEGRVAGASESGFQVTVSAANEDEARQAGAVAAGKVAQAMAAAGITGCRVVDVSPQ